MSHPALQLWAAMDKLFTSPNHVELLEDLLDDESGLKLEFFLHESLPEIHDEAAYESALGRIEMLARILTDDVEKELVAYETIVQLYPVVGKYFSVDELIQLINSFREDEPARLNQVDYYLGIWVLTKAEVAQEPSFSIEKALS